MSQVVVKHGQAPTCCGFARKYSTIQSMLFTTPHRMSYHEYYNAYVKRHVYKTKKCCQDDVTKLWNAAKQRFPKKEDLLLHVQQQIDQLLREATERKARTTLEFLYKVG